MIIPVRCFTCNRVLGSKYAKYLEIVNKEKDTENIITGAANIDPNKETVQQKAFKAIGISDRYCCKRHVISHIDLVTKI